jgi:hypothetical protein
MIGSKAHTAATEACRRQTRDIGLSARVVVVVGLVKVAAIVKDSNDVTFLIFAAFRTYG